MTNRTSAAKKFGTRPNRPKPVKTDIPVIPAGPVIVHIHRVNIPKATWCMGCGRITDHGAIPDIADTDPKVRDSRTNRTYGIGPAQTTAKRPGRHTPTTAAQTGHIDAERSFAAATGYWPQMPGAVTFLEQRVTPRFNGANMWTRRAFKGDFAGNTSFPCETVTSDDIAAHTAAIAAERARKAAKAAKPYQTRMDADIAAERAHRDMKR